MVKKELRCMFVLLVLFLSSVGMAAAAPGDDNNSLTPSGSGGLKLEANTFTKDASWSDINPWLPLASLVIVVTLFLYGVSLFVGLGASGTKINLASVGQNNDLRKEGQKGVGHIILGLFCICVSLLGIVMLWNSYGPGSW